MSAPLRLGTRGSLLARTQSTWVAEQLIAAGHAVELVEISTYGDQYRAAITAGSAQGVFTKEIQHALLDDRVDFAVHSLKDLPTLAVEELILAAVPARVDPRDALLTRDGALLADIAADSTIATGSLRRQAQLLHARPDLRVVGVRGNVDTRLAKLKAGEFAGVILAVAGLKRLGYEAEITEILPAEVMLPAIGQGALGIECRADDQRTRAALAVLDDVASKAAVVAERALLRQLQGGCLAPIGGYARLVDDTLSISAAVLSVDGSQRLTATAAGPAADAEAIGIRAAEDLLASGAGDLLAR